MGPFGFVKDNIHLGHGFELINSQWRVVEVLSKVSKRQNNKKGNKKVAKKII